MPYSEATAQISAGFTRWRSSHRGTALAMPIERPAYIRCLASALTVSYARARPVFGSQVKRKAPYASRTLDVETF